ncbi:MAG: sulfite exporter TauE/SafE family protein [Crocinitomicaceae bacterium]
MELLFFILLPLIALLYAAVGHGGASGYLALMAIFNFAPEEMRPTALLLNLFVAGISFVHFYRAGYFKFHLFLAFALTSVPFAFFGGHLQLNTSWYKLILGIFLLFSVVKMTVFFHPFSKPKRQQDVVKTPSFLISGLIGAGIGFVSALIGIGGGIILSPVILLMRWGSIKEAAAVSALFIWVNSLAGLIGQSTTGITFYHSWWVMVIFVVLGGFAGGYIGSKMIPNKNLRYLLGFVLFLAAIKLIFTV